MTSSPLSLREQIEQLLRNNWMDQDASPLARAEYLDVARLTLDAVEAEIERLWPDNGLDFECWAREGASEALHELRAQLAGVALTSRSLKSND